MLYDILVAGTKYEGNDCLFVSDIVLGDTIEASDDVCDGKS